MELVGENPRTDGGRLGLIGLLLIQIFVGYEWLMSGLVKIVRGGFPAGLADELTEKSEGIGGWYRTFLDDAVIPNAQAFGYLIELGELLIGVALIGAALAWLFAWKRLPVSGRAAVLLVTILASLGGIFMNVNFHLANGSAHPWLIPAEGFDEGVDLDSLLPAIQLVLAGVSAWLLVAVRRAERSAQAIGKPRPHGA